MTVLSASREMILSPETPLIDLNEDRTEAEREQQERKRILEQALLDTLKPMMELSEKVISLHNDFSTLARLADLKTDPTIEVESDKGKESVSIRVLMQELFDEASTLAETYQRDAAALGQTGYERTLDRFQVILDEMEELFQAFREATDKEPKVGVGSSSNDKAPTSGPNPITPPGGDQGSGDDPSSQEARENASFEEKLVSLETRIGEWRGIRQELLDLIGDRKYERFITESGPVGALARGKILKEVDAKIIEYHQALKEGKKPGKRERAWLDHHLQGMRGIIAMGMALRDQIRSERAPDTVQVKQASPQKPEEGSGPAGAGELPDPAVSDEPEQQRNYADIPEEAVEQYWHGLDREQGSGVTERILAVKEQMERWEKLSQAIAETGDGNRVGHNLASALNIPESSIRVQKDETPEQALERKISKLTDLALGFSKKRVNALLSELERKQAAGERIEDREFGLLKGDFFSYHRLLVAGEKILADICEERTKEAPIIAAEKEVREKREAEQQRKAFDRALVEADESVARWEMLGDRVGFGPLKEGIQQLNKKGFKFPPVSDVRDWLAEKKATGDWSEDERHDLVYEAVPSLRQQLAWAETVAARLPEKKVAPQRAAAESMVGVGDPEGERKREETAITFLEHRQQERLEALRRIGTKEAFDQYAGRERHQLYSLDGDIDIEAVRHFLRKKGFVQESAVERIHARAQALQDEVKEAYAAVQAKFYPDRVGSAQAERIAADIPADTVLVLDTWLAAYSGKRETNKETDQKIVSSLRGALKDYTKLTEIMTHPGIGTKLPEGLHDLALASQAENLEALIRQRGQAFTEALVAIGDPAALSEVETERTTTVIRSFSKECRDIKRALLPEVRMQELEERSRIFLNAYNDFFAVGDQVVSDDPESPVEELKSRVHDSYAEFLVQKEKFPEYSRGTEADYRAFQSDLGSLTDELIGSIEELERIMKRRSVAAKPKPGSESGTQEPKAGPGGVDLSPGAGSGAGKTGSGPDKKPEVVVPVVEATPPIQKTVESPALTEWERLAPAERRTVNQKILGLRNNFVTGLNAELKQENVMSQVERKKIIEAVLAKYVRMILQQKTEVSVSFTESEIDALVVELVKDVTPT